MLADIELQRTIDRLVDQMEDRQAKRDPLPHPTILNNAFDSLRHNNVQQSSSTSAFSAAAFPPVETETQMESGSRVTGSQTSATYDRCDKLRIRRHYE